MKLYLMRHGLAKSKHADLQRGLTDRGVREVKHIADHLAKRHVTADVIWHSGKNRARQTAEIVADHITCSDDIVQRDGILPDDPISPIVGTLGAMTEDVMLVGHLPFIDDLAAQLIGQHPTGCMTSCAGVMCLRRDDAGQWRCEWAIDPSSL